MKEGRWIVRKCKRPSPRWVAWRSGSKRKTGEVFDTWKQAVIYAICMQAVSRHVITEKFPKSVAIQQEVAR